MNVLSKWCVALSILELSSYFIPFPPPDSFLCFCLLQEAHILQSNATSRRRRVYFTTLALKRCCIWERKHVILPLSEAKLNYPVEEVGQRTPKKQGDARTASNTCAELALAEEGGGMNNDDTHVCAINQLLLGEQ